MACEYCNWISGHDFRCPKYIPPKTNHYCSICDNGIFNGEEYVKNIDNDYAHYDCVTDLSFREMIQWLGGEIKEMDDDYGEYY